MAKVLPQSFYRRDTERIARELLGCTLVHVVDGKKLAGRIVETEAYLGVTDAACHTFGDRRTARTKSMYLEGGHAYIYFIYGMHWCFNVVTRTGSEPEAVLIRAIEPTENVERMRELRGGKKQIADGPGKLCQALAIDRSCDGLMLDEKSGLFIERGKAPKAIEATPRVGVAYAGDAAMWPLRFLAR